MPGRVGLGARVGRPVPGLPYAGRPRRRRRLRREVLDGVLPGDRAARPGRPTPGSTRTRSAWSAARSWSRCSRQSSRCATTAEWLARLQQEGVPVAPINSVDQVVSDPQVLLRDMVVDMDHPSLGRLSTLGTPVEAGRGAAVPPRRTARVGPGHRRGAPGAPRRIRSSASTPCARGGSSPESSDARLAPARGRGGSPEPFVRVSPPRPARGHVPAPRPAREPGGLRPRARIAVRGTAVGEDVEPAGSSLPSLTPSSAPAPEITPVEDRAVRDASLDGLRGIAALWVFATHATYSGLLPPLLNFNGAGRGGVILFFFLSAFLLSGPFLRNLERALSWREWATYAIRRVCRIVPLYDGVVLVVFVLGFYPFGETRALSVLFRHLAFRTRPGRLLDDRRGDAVLRRAPGSPGADRAHDRPDSGRAAARPSRGLCVAGRRRGGILGQGLLLKLAIGAHAPVFVAGVFAAFVENSSATVARAAARSNVSRGCPPSSLPACPCLRSTMRSRRELRSSRTRRRPPNTRRSGTPGSPGSA